MGVQSLKKLSEQGTYLATESHRQYTSKFLRQEMLPSSRQWRGQAARHDMPAHERKKPTMGAALQHGVVLTEA